jgi:hypothetical protein
MNGFHGTHLLSGQESTRKDARPFKIHTAGAGYFVNPLVLYAIMGIENMFALVEPVSGV